MQVYLEILSKFPVIVLIFLAAATTIVGDIFAKYWSLDHKMSFFILSLIGYAGSGFFYMPVLLKEGLVTSSIVWTLMTVIGFILVGVVMFHERLSLVQTLGVGLGIIAIFILSND